MLLFIAIALSILLSIYFAWMWYKLHKFMLCTVFSVFAVGFHALLLLFFHTDIAIVLALFYLVVLLIYIFKLSKIIVDAHGAE